MVLPGQCRRPQAARLMKSIARPLSSGSRDRLLANIALYWFTGGSGVTTVSLTFNTDPKARASVRPQFGYVPWIWTQLVTFHALYDVRQDGVGIAREANLFALAHHETVEEFDLRASTFLHVLAHGGTLRRGGLLGVLEALFVAGAHRRLVALPRTRNRLRAAGAKSPPGDSRALARRESLRCRAEWRRFALQHLSAW